MIGYPHTNPHRSILDRHQVTYRVWRRCIFMYVFFHRRLFIECHWSWWWWCGITTTNHATVYQVSSLLLLLLLVVDTYDRGPRLPLLRIPTSGLVIPPCVTSRGRCVAYSLDCLQIRTSTQLSSILIPSLCCLQTILDVSCVRGIKRWGKTDYPCCTIKRWGKKNVFFLNIFSMYIHSPGISVIFSHFFVSFCIQKFQVFPLAGFKNHPRDRGYTDILAKTPGIQHFCREMQHETISLCNICTSPTAEISEHRVDFCCTYHDHRHRHSSI